MTSECDRRIAQRAQQDEEFQRRLVGRPRCGIIPSPDKLDIGIDSPGEDEIETRHDFNCVWKWLSECLNTGFYSKTTLDKGEQLELPVFKSAIHSAFKAFDPIRNTSSREAEEMVLLYYTGHGLSPSFSGSSSPLLEKVGYSREYFAAAQPYITPNRNVKGGELCLHHVGFCDLQGLLEPWIAAVKGKSKNSSGEKKNKHVVIIADSCYSGKLVEDLNELNQTRGPWNENRCTVTVQSACSSDEQTYGGYFTPCFVYYNQPENEEKLKQLIKEWNGKNEKEKHEYRAFTLPSPQLATTRRLENVDSENDPVLKLSLQGFQLCLFRDARFFKFCRVRHSIWPLGPPRPLNNNAVQQFLLQPDFEIMGYKLKKMATPNCTPLALFLVGSHHRAVCVHIHFKGKRKTTLATVSRVTLVEYQPTPATTRDPLALFAAGNENVKFYLKPNKYRRQYQRLVRECKNYVERKEPGRWANVDLWNMSYYELGVNQMFRMQERSAWMDNYQKEIVPKTSRMYLYIILIFTMFTVLMLNFEFIYDELINVKNFSTFVFY